MSTIPQLEVTYDCLRTSDGLLLLRLYDAGDCDSIPFPMSNASYWTPQEWTWNLRAALFDAREMGHIPLDAREVRLPDGTLFTIDGPMSAEEEEREFEFYQAQAEADERRAFRAMEFPQ